MIDTLSINGKPVNVVEARKNIDIVTPVNLEFRIEDGVIIFEEV